MKQPLRIAIIGSYPAADLLPLSDVRPKFQAPGAEHPASWLRSLCLAIKDVPDIQLSIFTDTRAVTKVHRATLENTPVLFSPRREPLRSNPYHLHLPAQHRLKPHLHVYQPDLVHGFGSQGQSGIIAVRQKQPSIISIQGMAEFIGPWSKMSPLQRKVEQFVERAVVRKARAFVAKTTFAQNWILNQRPDADITLIPNALQPEFINVQPTLSSSKVLCIGMLGLWKGPDTVIRAFARSNHEQAELHLIGSGPHRDRLETLVHELNLEQRVKFRGQLNREAIRTEMGDARCVVLGSRADTSPNVITEAHTAGLPVVGTRVGGIPDMIHDGVDGYLVPEEDVVSFSNAMTRLLENQALSKQLGLAGRNRVLTIHDPKRIAQLHVELYLRISESLNQHDR